MRKLNTRTRAVAVLILSCLIVALAGCGSDEPKDVHVRGSLAIADHGNLPKGATARISLIEHADNNTDHRIVAERTLHNLGKLPVSFDLEIGRKLLGAGGGQYGLNAQILDKNGNVRWETPVPQAVKPAGQQHAPVMVMLQSSGFHTGGDFKHYKCADKFSFDMAHDNKRAILRMGNRQISLGAQRAGGAPNAVYADDHDDQVTFGHEKITLAMDGATHINCIEDATAGKGQKDASKTDNGPDASSNGTRPDNDKANTK